MATIQELTETFSKLDMELVAGRQGNGQQMDYITILELPERTGRFKESGLVLSTFQSFQSVDQIAEHMGWLQSVGIIGVGFHTAHYKTVPEEIIKHSDEINMPLFSIPVDVPYHKILDIFNQLENKDLNLRTYEIYKINEKLMESVFLEKDPGYILNLVGNYIKENIVLLDAYLKVQAVWKKPSFPQEEMDRLTASITSNHKESLLQTRFFKRENRFKPSISSSYNETLRVLPIYSKDAFYGYLVINDKVMKQFYNKEVIQIALRAISLTANESPTSNSNHLKMQDIDRFEAVLKGEYENISMKDFHVSIPALSYCIRIQFNDSKGLKEPFHALSEVFLEKDSNALVWVYDEGLIALMETENEMDELKELLPTHREKSVGVSSSFKNPALDDIRLMNNQAEIALEHSRKKSSDWTYWNDMGIEKIAYHMTDTELFHSLDFEVLGPLISYDKKKNGELMHTLDCCLNHFFNLKAASEALFIHPNTVKYRLGQISKLLEMDIHHPSNYALLVTAFAIYNRKLNT